MPRILIAALIFLSVAAQLIVASGARAQPSARVAYLIDYASRTLDLVDLVNGTVALGVEPVGTVPNQIKVWGRTAYVVNSSPEGLQIIDLAGPTTTKTIDLGAGTNPWAVELAGDRAFVSLWGSDQVAVVDLVTGTVLDVIDVGISPEGMCLVGNELYVANSGFIQFGVYDPGSVSVIDIGTHDVTHTIPVGMNSQWCAVDGEGDVHVVCSDIFGTNNGRVFVVDPATHAAAESLWVGGFPGPISVSGGGIGWMVDYGAGLLSIDTVNHTVLHDINDPVPAGGVGALGLDVDASGRVHVALNADRLLTVITSDGTLEDSYPIGPGPQDVSLFEDETVPVLITHFSAARTRAGSIRLDWSTAGDRLIGCHIARRAADELHGDFIPLTSRPIEADRSGRYSFLDAGAGTGALVYRLTGIDAQNQHVVLGLYPVAAAGAPAAAPSASLAIAARPNPAAPRGGDTIAIDVAVPNGLRGVGGMSSKGVDVVVFDAAGRAIRLLHRGSITAGAQSLTWDGRDQSGRPTPPGAYFVRLITESRAASVKLILLP